LNGLKTVPVENTLPVPVLIAEKNLFNSCVKKQNTHQQLLPSKNGRNTGIVMNVAGQQLQ
jgi:hypothetical protein